MGVDQGIKDFFLVCFLRMGENSAGRQDEPLSRPFLDPQAPSDLDSSLHVDLGVSEPAHVLRRLGESSPKDKRTCRKMRSGAGVGTPPLSPLFIRMLILYSSSPDPHVRPQSSGPGPNCLGPGGAGRKGPHRPAAGRPPGPGWARAQGGQGSAAPWAWLPWAEDSRSQPRRSAEAGLPAQRWPPAGASSGSWNSEWRAQGHGAGGLVRGSGGSGFRGQLHTGPASWRYQAVEPRGTAPTSSALRSSAASGPCVHPSPRARARVPRAPEPASRPRAAASRRRALRCPSWALRSEAPPSVFCRLRNHSPGTIRPRGAGSVGLLPAGQTPSLTCPRPLMNRELELEAQSTHWSASF